MMRLHWIFALAAAVAAAGATAADIADSTTGSVRAKKALVIPPSLTKGDVINFIDARNADSGNLSGAIPPGYTEYSVQAGPHAGYSPTYPDRSYPVVSMGSNPGMTEAPAGSCGQDTTARVLYWSGYSDNLESGSRTYPDVYYTCEPMG